ncbi:unnamed protein product [Clavelina lepadiformis]|uniref:SOUL heme-binding protein n=1 Tax=Clavelina lepadiformis TaxID=159417 RepID=A0ABP0GRF3_CLALP
MKMHLYLLLVAVLLSGASSTPPYNGYEQPDWTLKPNQPKDGSFEVRSYPAANWTVTSVTAPNFDVAGNIAFWRVFRYIQGSNVEAMKMAMTVPVTTEMPREDCPFCNVTYTMAFYLPSKYQLAPPKPTDGLIRTEHRAPLTVYVRRFSGWANAQDWRTQASMLHDSLLENGVLDSEVDRTRFYAVGYDSPSQLFNRRNEVWLIAV